MFQKIVREDKVIGYWGEKGKEIITRCGGWRLSSNKEGNVLLREVGRTKCY